MREKLLQELVFARLRKPVLLCSCGSPTGEPPDYMVEITIKLPDALARAFGATPEARSQRLTEDAAIAEYRAGRLSQRQVGEMLGLGYWQTESFLAERNVSLNYSLGDLQADRATLDEILGLP